MKRGRMNKKGLDAIVTTIIIILLALVAIGIIWAVLRGVVTDTSEQVSASAKCVGVDITATAAQCDVNGVCNVTYKRSAGGEEIGGVVVVLSNGQSSNQTKVAGNVPIPATRTAIDFATGLSPVPNKAEVAAYFVDASGNENVCPTTTPFEF